MQQVIISFLTKIKLLEIIPSEWYEGIVKPIHKSSNWKILNNYLGITISCVVYKLMVSIIETQTMDYIESKNVLSIFQGAFRKKCRAEDHIFTLKGVCSLRKIYKVKTFLPFLDISKAFDTLDRSKLFHHIYKMGYKEKPLIL